MHPNNMVIVNMHLREKLMAVIMAGVGASANATAITSTDYIQTCKVELANKKQAIVDQEEAAKEAEITKRSAEQAKVLLAQEIKTQVQLSSNKYEDSDNASDIGPNSLLSNVPEETGSTPSTEDANEPPAKLEVDFQLKPGRLQPQIERLIKTNFPKITGVVWSVDTNLRWFNDYKATGATYSHILSSILRRYEAKAKFWGNNVVEIMPKQEKL
jgi:hypothetical protein